jgi:hypothetical protein
MNGDTQPAWAGKTPANQIGANGANHCNLAVAQYPRRSLAGRLIYQDFTT